MSEKVLVYAPWGTGLTPNRGQNQPPIGRRGVPRRVHMGESGLGYEGPSGGGKLAAGSSVTVGLSASVNDRRPRFLLFLLVTGRFT